MAGAALRSSSGGETGGSRSKQEAASRAGGVLSSFLRSTALDGGGLCCGSVHGLEVQRFVGSVAEWFCCGVAAAAEVDRGLLGDVVFGPVAVDDPRSEEHTSELQ